MSQLYDGIMLQVESPKDVTIEISSDGSCILVGVGVSYVLKIVSTGKTKVLDHRPKVNEPTKEEVLALAKDYANSTGKARVVFQRGNGQWVHMNASLQLKYPESGDCNLHLVKPA